MQGGTTASPIAVSGNNVQMSHTDHLTMVTGFDFFGAIAGGYAAQVVRLTDITVDSALLQLESNSSEYYGVVVRWDDPQITDYEIERSASATEANAMDLPTLPDDGTPVYGIGEIIPSSEITVLDVEGNSSYVDVYDTDRWRLDLSDRPAGTPVTVAVQFDRHYVNFDGDVGPADPWMALVDEEYVPAPSETDTVRTECEGGIDFSFPTPILEYLYYQVFLSPGAVATEDLPEEGDTGTARYATGGTFDACGTASEAETTCADDWDLDGVLDEDEPQPGSFLQQVQVMQCGAAGNDPLGYVPLSTDLIDVDEIDEDEDPYSDPSRDLGGRTGESGEEAYIEMELIGGASYLIIVGAGADTGTYEFSVRQLL